MLQTQEEKKKLEKEVLAIVKAYLKGPGFNDRKLTDMPTDALQVVPRKFVTLNGATTARPTSPVKGQSYFDSTLGYPVWYDGTQWVDATGTPA